MMISLAWASPSQTADSVKGQHIELCADEAEWPPFQYRLKPSKNMQSTAQGVTTDVLEQILGPHDISFNITFLPWKRCLDALDRGSPYIMTSDISITPERKQQYLYSEPYYTLTPYYYYLKEAFPDGLDLEAGKELAQFQPLCGLNGYNYNVYGVANDQVKRGVKTHNQLIEMLVKKRCRVILALMEIVLEDSDHMRTLISSDVVDYKQIPEEKSQSFHFAVSKNYPQAKELIQIINKGLKELPIEYQLMPLEEKHIKLHKDER